MLWKSLHVWGEKNFLMGLLHTKETIMDLRDWTSTWQTLILLSLPMHLNGSLNYKNLRGVKRLLLTWAIVKCWHFYTFHCVCMPWQLWWFGIPFFVKSPFFSSDKCIFFHIKNVKAPRTLVLSVNQTFFTLLRAWCILHMSWHVCKSHHYKWHFLVISSSFLVIFVWRCCTPTRIFPTVNLNSGCHLNLWPNPKWVRVLSISRCILL